MRVCCLHSHVPHIEASSLSLSLTHIHTHAHACAVCILMCLTFLLCQNSPESERKLGPQVP
jgi:hypothetical protein